MFPVFLRGYMKKISTFIIYLFSFIYLEFLLKIFVLDRVFVLTNINMIVFLMLISSLLTGITHLFKEKMNKIIFYVIMVLNFILFSTNYVLKTFFGFYLTFSAFKLSDQIVNGFLVETVIQVLQRLGGIFLLFIPTLLCIIFRKKIGFKRYKLKSHLAIFCLTICLAILYLFSLNISKNKEYSAYQLFYKVDNPIINIEKLGIINSLFIDSYRTIFGFNEELVYETDREPVVVEPVYSYNNLDIDFNNIIDTTSDTTIKNMSEYFVNSTGTLQSEHTGIFKGKNLILFMAESFNGVSVSEELTPTLYRLINSGFVFENFYTPTVYSTIGGEFQELTGLYAAGLDTLSKFRSGKNSFPMGIANLFTNEGYSVFAYHDSYSTFQDRNKYLASLGFNVFEGCESSANAMKCSPWPGSDIDMIDSTYEKYINEENFMVFYASVSGHGSYTNASRYYKKYQELVDAYYPNAPVESKAYVAGQMELDRALERLIQILEENGKLEDTVIALVGDHAPYYLYEKSMDYINSISTYERDKKIELYHSNFILYNSGMEPVKVSKVGSQIDVIPTLYNIFGLNYDSRLFIGSDILSTEPGLAIMSDNSWVTDEGYYVASTGVFTQTSDNILDESYVSNINSKVKNKILMSKNILLKDYYSLIFKSE